MIQSTPKEQVAQLWQRDRAMLASFSINVQLYSQNHKIAFLAPLWEISGNTGALSESFTAKKLSSRVLSRDCQFYP